MAGIGTADLRQASGPATPWWRARTRLATAVLGVSIAVLVLSFGWRFLTAPSTSDRAAIAVVPFSNGHVPEHDYFSDGLTKDLITSLGRFRILFVIARDSTFVYKGKQVSPQQVNGYTVVSALDRDRLTDPDARGVRLGGRVVGHAEGSSVRSQPGMARIRSAPYAVDGV